MIDGQRLVKSRPFIIFVTNKYPMCEGLLQAIMARSGDLLVR